GDAPLALAADALGDRLVAGARQLYQVELAPIDGLGDRLRRRPRVGVQRVADPVRDPPAELAMVAHLVDEHVRQGHVQVAGAVHPEQAGARALDRDARLARDFLTDLGGDTRSRLAAGQHHAGVEIELALWAVRAHRSSRTIGKGITSRRVSRSVRIITSLSTPMPPPAVGE